MKLSFLGAAKVVTGSCYLIETNGKKILIDCGMFQGSKELEALNETKFNFNPREIDFMILSHAHIDHSGRIPKLVKEGFTGKIYCTKPTADLIDIMLKDSAKIQENDAEYENKKRKRAGDILIEPLYTIKDAEESMKNVAPFNYEQIITVDETFKFRFKDAGHILGSAITELWITEEEKTMKIVFSGDLGMPNRPILKNPEYIDGCDYLVIESTYCNTVHEKIENSKEEFFNIIEKTTQKGGTVVIPSFAVGRTQELIYELNKEYEKKEDYKKIPVYVDSPMSVLATKAFMNNPYVFDEDAKKLILSGDNIFEFENLHYVTDVEESKMLNKVKFPRIIISSSGMATAGRVRHHLKHNLWDENSAVIFVGSQAVGSLGRIIQEGAKEVKINGETIQVNAKVYSLAGFSAHADEPMLLDWIDKMQYKPKKIFITHGEVDEQEPFAKTIKDNLQINCTIPNMNESVTIKPLEENEKPYIINSGGFEIIRQLDDLLSNIKSLEKNKENIISMEDKEKYTNINNKLMSINSDLIDINLILGK